VSQDIQRTANLLQISSPFGKAMESVNYTKISKAIYQLLLDKKDEMSED